MATPDTMLSIAEVAMRLGISKGHAYRLARSGKLPGAVRVGRLWRVDARRLERGLFGPGDAYAAAQLAGWLRAEGEAVEPVELGENKEGET